MVQTMVSLGLPTFILLAGMVDDLRSRKVHNWLTVGLAVLALLVVGIVFKLPGIQQGALGASLALALCLPLFLAGIMGGGDLKLFTAFGLATDWNTVFWVLIFSFIWGALLGIFRAVLSGKGRVLVKNTLALLSRNVDRSTLELQKVPYTVALFFGWLTQMSLVHGGGLPW
ncbi:MAG: prepilin peptidase [Bdellovibrionaceae bacterium]|nr:prepilin peptidase [Bdellovibrionales bacterium]MCB9085355.1 prepilin peptidase [Pseudobdellovibrionaceae bacterium]